MRGSYYCKNGALPRFYNYALIRNMTHHMTASIIIISLFIAIAVLFGLHYFFYFSISSFFSISSQALKVFLISSFSFLGASFFLSTLLARWRENLFTRGFYFFSGFWLGLITNLLIAIIIVWLIIWIGNLFGTSPSRAILAIVFFGLAFLVSIYGSWSSYNPKIKKITVKIPNLTENWKGKKIVQLSDMHLGHIYREDFVEKVVKEVNLINPELVLITGDLFDGMDGELANIISPIGEIVAKKGIYFVTGNHETYLGLSEVFRVLQKTKVNVLKDEVVNIDGLKLIGINYPVRGEDKNIVATLNSLKKDFYGAPNILMYHSPVNIEQIKNSGVNLELCGHTHNGQLFPLGLITKMIYSGYDYGLFQMGSYTLYVTNGVGTWGPPMRIGNAPEIVEITLQ